MEIIGNPLFWGEVGLAAASKLALLAAVLWVARLAVAERTPRTSIRSVPAIPGPAAEPSVHREVPLAKRTSASRAPVGYWNLRRPPEHREHTSDTADQLRQRLLDYVERRAAERVRS